MVLVTPEEVDAMRKGKARLEEMSQFDRDLCQADKAKHLIIPMSDVYNLRRIAGVMHTLASDMENMSRRTDRTARSIILEVRAMIEESNHRIREISGRVKRKRTFGNFRKGDAD